MTRRRSILIAAIMPYPDRHVTSDGKGDHDIKKRIGKAKTVFGNMKKCAIGPYKQIKRQEYEFYIVIYGRFCSTDVSLGQFQQESRAITKKPRDATVVRCGLKFADIHYNFKSTVVIKPDFRAIDIPAQNRI